jgi:Ca-activated chloride channel homolog
MPETTQYLQLAQPHALWMLALAPVLLWLLLRAERKRREAVEAFTSPTLAPRLIGGVWGNHGALRASLLSLALACLAVAAARPRLGMHLERVERKGADILVAVDVSNSMLAQDVEPSRLEAAKREILGLIARLQGDRIGIITFSTQAFLYCPLTADYDAASMFVESIDARMTSGGGTALAAALRESARAFEAGEGDQKVVVLVSDGEDWGQGAREEAKACASKGVRTYAIGIGTETGAPIPLYDRSGQFQDMRREEGKVILSRLRADDLRQVAALGGGRYFEGGAADLGAAAVYDRVAALGASRSGSYTFRTYAERYQWPLGLGLILLLTEFLLAVRGARPHQRQANAGLLAAVSLTFMLCSGFSLFETAASVCRAANRLFTQGKFAEAFGKYARALQLERDDPVLHLNSGDALYRQGRYAEAREEYAKAAAASDPRLASLAHFNAGNASMQEPNAEGAIEEYKNALRCDPSNALAKRNLELARRRKQQQPQQQQQKQQDREDRQDRGQQQQPQQRSSQEQKSEQRPAQTTPMTPEEARALLRQAQYEDAKLRRELARVVPRPTETTGKDW